MGGAFGKTPWGKGNMGDAEFNIFYDPEAAKIVFGLDIKITVMVDYDPSISETGSQMNELYGNVQGIQCDVSS